MKRILVVDDDRQLRRTLLIMIQRLGFEPEAAENGRVALARLENERFDLVLTDLKMPEMDGLELLAEIRRLGCPPPVIVMTAYGTIQTAIEAMRGGAFDYVLKPYDNQALELTIRKAFDLERYRTQSRFLKSQLDDSWGADIQPLPGMGEVMALMEKLAPTNSSVLITGETGTGKEVAARVIHRLSPRRDNLFVPLNCAALPAELLESELFGHVRGAFTGAAEDRTGKFEVADGGTLFLDEIGEMPIKLQSKLLRVLEDGVVEPLGGGRSVRVDVRVLSATNKQLPDAVATKEFRSDLYYRINTFQVALSPLRERPDDVPILAHFFLERFARDLGKPALELTDEAVALLVGQDWPGNVRELRNLMERVAVLCPGPRIDSVDLQTVMPGLESRADDSANQGESFSIPDPPGRVGLHEAVEQFERKVILQMLGETNDNKAEAARRLGISERNLWYKLRKHGL